MPITIQHERANIYRLDVSGRLDKPEFDRCQESLAAEIRRIGPVRLLFVLSQFEGWEQNPNWGDLSHRVPPSCRPRCRALRTVLDWTPEMGVYFRLRKRFPGSLICEGETDGFETT